MTNIQYLAAAWLVLLFAGLLAGAAKGNEGCQIFVSALALMAVIAATFGSFAVLFP